MNKKQLQYGKKRGKLKAVKAKSNKDEIKSDVQGSYTGVPENEHEKPVQDADDL